MTDHPYIPGTTWAPKSGRGKPRTIVDRRPWRGREILDHKGRPYVWWDEPTDWGAIACRRATVTQFERWAGGAGGMKIDGIALSVAAKACSDDLPFGREGRESVAKKIIAAYLAALPPDPASASEPPEGKLRVRVLVAMAEGGEWFANSWASGGREDFEECLFMSCDDPQFRWIEADVTPWQPPAEETVQGREVDHD